jgi:hypothetical protein
LAIQSHFSSLTPCRGEVRHLRCQLARCGSPHLAKKLAKRRLLLQSRIDAFLAKTPTALSSLLPQDQFPISGISPLDLDEDDEAVEDDDLDYDSGESEDNEEYVIDVEEDDDNTTGDDVDVENRIRSTPTTNGVPESIMLPLPSHLKPIDHPDPTIDALSEVELIIWQSQASDSLQHLRLSLGMKSGIFRSMKSNPKSQKTKSRAWKAINVATAAVQQHARSYCLAQHAIVQLNADPSTLSKYPPLQKQDLTISRDIVEENRLGQKSEHLSWVWRLDIGKDLDKDAWMDESE